jgi:SAM-dependent methyltransferase
MIVTQDVFEHIPDPNRGFAEVARVLKSGGAHVFTIPYYVGKPTFIRARLNADGSMAYFAPKDFHGNPVDPNGSLVTTEWGDDVADFICRASGMTTAIYHYHDPAQGLLGEFLYVFVSRKSPCPATPARHDGATPSNPTAA